MTYDKPKNVKYTDMCIYIDENVYEPNHDQVLVYQYIYHVVLMLAKQASLFTEHRYYDGFAIFGANRIYRRLTNKKQFEYNSDGTPKMTKIKSVLNYAKKILYHLKVDYEQQEYSQALSKDSVDNTDYNYDNIIKSSLSGINLVNFELTMSDVGKTCKKFLQTIPYPVNSAEWLNIYVSVMLTFMNQVTLKNKQLQRIAHLESTCRLRDYHIENFYNTERYSEPVLFHLDSSMSNYITVLARQLRHIVGNDLSSILHTDISYDYMLVDAVVKDVLNKEYDNDENKNRT